MSEYRGNTLAEIERRLEDGQDKYLIYRPQMEQVVGVLADVTEAKNEVVREVIALSAQLKQTRNALLEYLRLQYGDEPKDLDAVIAKYAEMRAQRLKLDTELGTES